jgi:hypothetical protein
MGKPGVAVKSRQNRLFWGFSLFLSLPSINLRYAIQLTIS